MSVLNSYTTTLLTATRDGLLQVAAGTARLSLGGAAGTIMGITTTLDVAANADVVSDIKLNGITIFTNISTRPKIVAGNHLSTESVVSVAFSANSYLTFDVTACGDTSAPGQKLITSIRIKYSS